MKNNTFRICCKAFLFFILMQQAFTNVINSQSLNDYRTKTSGPWSDAATWSCYSSSGWVNAAVPPDYNSGVITIRTGHTADYNSQDYTVDQVIVESGAQLTVNSSVYFLTNDGSGDEITVSGIFLYQGLVPASMPGTGALKNGGTVIFNTTSSASNMNNFFSAKEPLSTWIYRGSETTNTPVSLAGRTYGNLSFESSSGVYSFNYTGTNPLTVNGNFLIGSNVIMNISNTAGNVFKGNFTNSGTVNYGAGTQIFSFSGTAEQLLSGTGTLNFENLNVSSGAVVKLQNNVSSNNTVNVNGTIDCSGRIIGGTGAFNLLSGGKIITANTGGVNGSINTVNKSFAPDADFEFNGTSQQVTGALLIACRNIKVSNPSGLALSAPLSVGGTLELASGKVLTQSYDLTLTASGTVSGAGTSAYINTSGEGALKKLGLQSGIDFTFPVGNGTYTPVTINYSGTPDDISVRTMDTVDFQIFGTAYVRKKWIINEGTEGGTNALLTFQWNSSEHNTGFNPGGTVYAGRRTGNTFEEKQAVVIGSDPYSGTAGIYSLLGEFIIANQSVLPVKLLSFSGEAKGRCVLLKWSTSFEFDNLCFFIERRREESNLWSAVGRTDKGQSAGNGALYCYTDENLNSGKYFYRLKQTDFGGNSEYFYLDGYIEIKTPGRFILRGNYPNPFNSTTKILLEMSEDCRIFLRIFDITGREVFKSPPRIGKKGYLDVNVNLSGLSSGVYIYSITAEGLSAIYKAYGKALFIK
ncbi:MAG TPA: T9SS type A sorting domain-containing protein [Ignavibacteria bacterium]|nr:T9SS type A sorting domain-containing protein [Ignavibacteria bacterium]